MHRQYNALVICNQYITSCQQWRRALEMSTGRNLQIYDNRWEQTAC